MTKLHNMQFMLVLQFPEAFANYDDIVEIESELIDRLGNIAEVDGHDSGAGESNIFLLTDDPDEAFAVATEVISSKPIPSWKAAYRPAKGSAYTVLRPKGSMDFKVS